MKNKNILYGIIVVVVLAVLIFIILNGRSEDTYTAPLGEEMSEEADAVENDMSNEEQNEEQNEVKEGVTIEVLKEGTGEVVKAGDKVSVNYTGTLLDGTKFDSNTDAKFGHLEPFSFTLGAGQVIEGWDIGVSGMKVGEKRKLTILPEYGYGAYGAGSTIPPNATLVFEVELLEVK